MTIKLHLYQVDAFANKPFEGNPAAVVTLQEWLPDALLQNVAMENNLSETAFFVKEEGYRLRWFTPTDEVDLCGHATLATAHVLFNHMNYQNEVITFKTNSGPLQVRLRDSLLEMDFPVAKVKKVTEPEMLSRAMGVPAVEVYKDTDYMYVVEDQELLSSLAPDMKLLTSVETRGVIVTASADEEGIDFVSRFFAPAVGVDEDPVTGSAHTMLTPYWSRRLNKRKMVGKQISRRGGMVFCEDDGLRVKLSGKAHTYLKGEIEI